MKHAGIKDHIINIASTLFYKNGYNSTGINEIISEAGIAKATLYNHFKSKEDICLAYLKFKNTSFLQDLKSFCNSKKEGNDRLIAMFDFLSQFYSDKDFNGCWCIKTVAEIPKENTRIRKEIQYQKSLFIDFIQELIEQNRPDLADHDSNPLAKRIYLLYESAVSESHLHEDNWPIKESRGLCRLLLE